MAGGDLVSAHACGNYIAISNSYIGQGWEVFEGAV